MLFSPFCLLGGIFLGWSIGSKDFANVFGTAVMSRMLRFWNAAVLASVFTIAGAILQGQKGIETIGKLTPQSLDTAIISSVAAALTITILNIIKVPISTAQAVVGSIIGVGIMTAQVKFVGLGKIVFCWIGAPVGAGIFAIPLYLLLGQLYNSLNLNIFQRDIILRTGLIIVGCYAAYAMGANNVANITAVFVSSHMLNSFVAALIGGASIAFGILTFSKGVMQMIGGGLIKLDAFSALIVVMAEALSVHTFAMIGVPVSTSHAIIGAILGVGLLRGIRAMRVKNLIGILLGWVLAPFISCLLAMLIYFLCHLRYIP